MKHGDKPEPAPKGRIPRDMGIMDRMRRKFKTKSGKKTYSKRMESVEPVFGQIEEARGIRSFLLRGLEKVKAEWTMICLTHNVLKLWRHIWGNRRIAARLGLKPRELGLISEEWTGKYDVGDSL